MKIFYYHKNELLTWFRLFGYGLCFRNLNYSGFKDTFSERQGYKKYIDLFGYRITMLKSNKQL